MQLEGESGVRKVEEEKGGGEDVVICLRDYKERWHNMMADCECECHDLTQCIKSITTSERKHNMYLYSSAHSR